MSDKKRTAVVARLRKELEKQPKDILIKAVKAAVAETNGSDAAQSTAAAASSHVLHLQLSAGEVGRDRDIKNERIDQINSSRDAERMQQRMTRSMLERYGPRGMPAEVALLLEVVGVSLLPPGPSPNVPKALARATQETGPLRDPYRAKDVVYVGIEPGERLSASLIKIRFDKKYCLSKIGTFISFIQKKY